ncbi:hypothetical protein [Burkholderia sp. Ac-20365]|jgi:hypothetical protein|uniref:hypothetical protein n=1 Tax=Burkholderia sp. Ac-20365 TaxID=2703897 RepID=UPI00197B263B|nr:hypothetical protein [Burkholderia sp. Ac-20365]MBN3767475.1 hypothetical protein [Burkholderia sp. Ac-20365]
MLRHYPDASESKSPRTTMLVALAALALAAACGTGIAALTGLLPESDEVAAKVTTIPLIDVWRSEPNAFTGGQSENGASAISAQ